MLLLRGMGGTGKTTLLNYLREWWQTTQFAKDVFYFGYDERAYTLEQIIQNVGQRVYDEFEWASVQPLSLEAKAEMLAETLCGEPYILMLDNLESVTGQELGIQNTLPEAEQAKLRDFLLKLVGGKTRVVLGSRSGEEWLAQVYRDNRYALQGLDPQSRTELAEKILEKQVSSPQRIEQLRQDNDFGRLMKLLAGYPLAMEVVLANLTRQSPAEILAALDAADVNLDSGSEDKTQSILKCVEYSFQNLPDESKRVLFCLFPFNGCLVWNILEIYMEELISNGVLPLSATTYFHDSIRKAINLGLLEWHEAKLPGGFVRIHPILPYFLSTKISDKIHENTKVLKSFLSLMTGSAQLYRQLMEEQDVEKRNLSIAFCELQYQNLFRAFELSLESGKDFCQIHNCISLYLARTGNVNEKLRINSITERHMDQAFLQENSGDFQFQLELLFCIGDIADDYKLRRAHDKALMIYEFMLEKIKSIHFDPEHYKSSFICKIILNIASTLHHARKYELSESKYREAIEKAIGHNLKLEEAMARSGLSTLLRVNGNLDAALEEILKARQLFVTLELPFEVIEATHTTGMIYQQIQDYENAFNCYLECLLFARKSNNSYLQLATLNQIGRIGQLVHDFQLSLSSYQEALDIAISESNKEKQAAIYHNLGIIYFELEKWDEAESAFKVALEIAKTNKDFDLIAKTYYELGMLSEEKGRDLTAVEYYRSALEMVDFLDIQSKAFLNLALAKSAYTNERNEVLTHVTKALELYESLGDEERILFIKENFADFF
jgi:tetratricopeptide (TPR) repeat protein